MIAALLLAAAASASVPAAPDPVADPATATIHVEDADRFAALFTATDGKPTAEQIQRGYLDPGSYGIHVFTPNRIENATTLAAYVAASPQKYRDAIDRCLPQVKQANGELQAIYARLHALYPDRALPQIYVVFGRGNSGGTAGPGAQVLGLEVLCETAPDAAALRRTLRRFFAHETVHTWQGEPAGDDRNPLLEQVLIEGAADYIAALATGAAPDADRAAWALPRETLLWAAFQRDLAIMHTAYRTDAMDSAASNDAAHRWIENYGAAPDGWPFELGYWIGMRMWERYVAASPDRDQALRDVLDWRDANAVSARAGAPNIVATQQTR